MVDFCDFHVGKYTVSSHGNPMKNAGNYGERQTSTWTTFPLHFPAESAVFFWKKPLVIWRDKTTKKISKTSSLIAFNFGHCFEEIQAAKTCPIQNPPIFLGGASAPRKMVDLKTLRILGREFLTQDVMTMWSWNFVGRELWKSGTKQM